MWGVHFNHSGILTLTTMGRSMKALKKGPKRAISSSEDSASESQPTVRKRTKKGGSPVQTTKVHDVHSFSEEERAEFTSSLLKWYHSNKRDLPWRSLADDLSPTDRAYGVLVSEVMLQQTQVATVIPYYVKWMGRWPTFHHLAQATLNDVNEVWAGMGYYSRAKRLWEAAKKVDGELNNQVPLTSTDLQEKLPGVGRYTAGAVASIAFGEKAAAVDGNVIRVLSRVRCIGADQTSKAVLDHIWKLSDQLVSAKEPGNFNQAMMDLGATICTPKKPSCKSCPLAHVCLANQRVQQAYPLRELQLESKPKVQDIEDASCNLCLKQAWDINLGVMNFPQKAKKAPPRKEVTLVCVVQAASDGSDKYLLTKRPQGGLLAGLWEFPNSVFEGDWDSDNKGGKEKHVNKLLQEKWGACRSLGQPHFVAEVPHIFSHIHQLYVVYSLKIDSKNEFCVKEEHETEWMNADEILSSAISTAMKKVFAAFTASLHKDNTSSAKGRQKSKKTNPDTSSRKVSDFFKKVEK